ncbi:chemotaxis protein CheW [Agitococcus lubricus]|uniref:Chemotaxis-related protein WspB n=1 Tax=Agitococcus lubricus TaxID=1077255 RepID=A0A2T5IVG7_9GAMM|nr:chemotaxis protein CheW [Agitococcus lubricus]PTQ87877.1 chemotaxis-related protein WspB [Agitococcus lubricus]
MALLDSRSKPEQKTQLYLLFNIGTDRYALSANEIVEVTHLRPLKQLLAVPEWIAGLLNYRQQMVPVLDLAARTGLPSARDKTSTRIVIVQYQATEDIFAPVYLLGLILEQATDTLRCLAQDFHDYGVHHPESAYLGPVLAHTQGLIQRITIPHLLPEEVHARLFLQTGEQA